MKLNERGGVGQEQGCRFAQRRVTDLLQPGHLIVHNDVHAVDDATERGQFIPWTLRLWRALGR